jgi:hypothetical protein
MESKEMAKIIEEVTLMVLKKTESPFEALCVLHGATDQLQMAAMAEYMLVRPAPKPKGQIKITKASLTRDI